MRDRYWCFAAGGVTVVDLDDPRGRADVVDDWFVDFFPADYRGRAVEVGAYDGFYGSQTLRLEQLGWTCLCIEANPALGPLIKQNRNMVWMGACSDHEGREMFHIHPMPACSSLSPSPDHPFPNEDWKLVEVEVRTLDSVLDLHGFNGLDVATIDTEGTELDVLKGLDLKQWQPKLLCVESWDEHTPITPYLKGRGYRFADRRGHNNLYLREPA